jgi:hypothetical protein
LIARDRIRAVPVLIELLENRRLLSRPATGTAELPFAPLAGRSASGGVFVSDQDIGSPAQAGSLSYLNGTYTITAGGSDIGGNADQFHFAYNTYSADGSIIANVASLANTNGAAKAGLMFRNGTGASAAYAGIFVTPSSGAVLSARSADGTTAGETSIFGIAAPRFLKLSRSGSQFAGYYSSDAITWTQLGSSQTVNLSANALVGLAVTSRNVTTTTTATFRNVSVLMPAGWNENDVGAPGLPGFAEYDPADNTFAVTGSGSDIGGTSDQFNFASRNMTGGGSVVARVDALGSADPSAKAGVMVRSDYTAGSIFADVVRTPQNNLLFQWRSATGAAASSTSIAVPNGAIWLKLAQQGDAVSAYFSSNNVTFTQIGAAQTVPMASATALAGLAVTSHNNAALTSAAFSSVSIVQTGFADADIGAPPLAGAATYDAPSDTYTLSGSGSGLFRSASTGGAILRAITPDSPSSPVIAKPLYDQLNFASRGMSGDGSVISYVNSIANTDAWAEAGLMIRADASNAAAAFAGVFATAGNGLVFEWRPAGATAVRRQVVVPATGLNAAPTALKLVRAGNTFWGLYSTDETTWLPIGPAQTVTMPTSAAAGIAVSAHNNGALCTATFTGVTIGNGATPPGAGVYSASDQLLLHDLEQRSVQFFYNETNATTGLVPDSSNASGGGPSPFSSIAAVGFGLTALTIGDQRGFLTHANAYQRALNTVNFLWSTAAQVNGFFYHFLNPATGARYNNSELSSVDTALLMAGVVNAAQYWSGTPLATVATNVFDRVNWPWMQKPNGQFYGAWTPESGFSSFSYGDFSEAVIIYLLGLGSSTHPTATSSWNSWSRTPVIHYAGYTFVTAQTGALFTVQYPQAWFDLRGLTDGFGLNYYVNSQTATLAQRQMCINLAGQFSDYGPNLWGITASDSQNGYTVWGGPPPTPNINGTVVPTAPGGSLAFTPRQSIDALRFMQQTYGTSVYKKYGFVDAFNPLTNWTSSLVLGIDQGMMLIAAENSRSSAVWNMFSQSPVAQQALARAFPSTTPAPINGVRPPLPTGMTSAQVKHRTERAIQLIDSLV